MVLLSAHQVDGVKEFGERRRFLRIPLVACQAVVGDDLDPRYVWMLAREHGARRGGGLGFCENVRIGAVLPFGQDRGQAVVRLAFGNVHVAIHAGVRRLVGRRDARKIRNLRSGRCALHGVGRHRDGADGRRNQDNRRCRYMLHSHLHEMIGSRMLPHGRSPQRAPFMPADEGGGNESGGRFVSRRIDKRRLKTMSCR